MHRWGEYMCFNAVSLKQQTRKPAWLLFSLNYESIYWPPHHNTGHCLNQLLLRLHLQSLLRNRSYAPDVTKCQLNNWSSFSRKLNLIPVILLLLFLKYFTEKYWVITQLLPNFCHNRQIFWYKCSFGTRLPWSELCDWFHLF